MHADLSPARDRQLRDEAVQRAGVLRQQAIEDAWHLLAHAVRRAWAWRRAARRPPAVPGRG
jgi:hypothetical protein